jgi:hypothetical protein
MPTLKRISRKQILILITALAVLGFTSRRSGTITASVRPGLRQSDTKVVDLKRFPDEPYKVREDRRQENENCAGGGVQRQIPRLG